MMFIVNYVFMSWYVSLFYEDKINNSNMEYFLNASTTVSIIYNMNYDMFNFDECIIDQIFILPRKTYFMRIENTLGPFFECYLE